MKKLIVLLALLMPMLALAQDIDGTWKFHPAYALSTATDMIDTESYVYALSNGAIMRLDKASQQVQTLTPENGLSEVLATGIYYNYDSHYLLITYQNSNIDLLYDDGRMVNVSDLADAIMTVSRKVNDVTFAHGKAYLATDFGLAVLDDAHQRVAEFHIYNQAMTSAAQVGDYLVIAYGDQLYASQGSRETLNDFFKLGVTHTGARLYTANDSVFFMRTTSELIRCSLSMEQNNILACTTTSIVAAAANNLQRTNGGWLANFRAKGYYYTIASDDAYTATKVSGNTTSLYSCCPGDETTWQIDATGIHPKGNNATAYKPDGLHLRTGGITLCYSMYNRWDNKFYITSADQNFLFGNISHQKHIMSYDGEQWTDDTPTALRNSTKLARITFIPGMANSYFAADRGNAFYRVVGGQVAGKFVSHGTDGPLHYPPTSGNPNGICWLPGLLVDSQRNLWMVGTDGGGTNKYQIVAMLPAEKLLADTVNVEDWVTYDFAQFSTSHAQRQSFAESTTGVKAYVGGYTSDQLNFWRLKPGSTEIEVMHSKQFIDQKGRSVDWYLRETGTLTPDSTGHIWIGAKQGIFYVKADEVFTPGFRVTVPETVDGEDSPYKLSITSIGVDPDNRKWIGTRESGLFVVNADGSRVLKHFDVDNSSLPSPLVYDVAVSRDRAIITTDNGVVELNMNDVPSAIDYTAVTAAPMLVTPDYTGFVTIGQVDVGACVRITDRDGNIVRQFTATTGQVAWDACDETGERVPTGVYNIYAALTADQLPGTPQVRVKVIK
ncbi:MAG: hypothetical protein IJ160_01970 [Muribaculaceae bacterium]|nr:hypothetical protein [Muribaculaceae bacterium]